MTAPLLLAAISFVILVQVGIGFGVAFWRLQHKEAPLKTGGWAGWREFRIERDAFEDAARTQRSLILTPVDEKPLPEFAPGQYLTFSLDLAASPMAPKRSIMRCYSLSDQPNPKSYRITIKRMSAPSTRPDLPAGAASSLLHDAVHPGDLLKIKAPAGNFVLDGTSDVPAIFIAGGIGVTPMISMISWSLAHRPERRLHLFYGVKSSDDCAFRPLLERLAQTHPSFLFDTVFSAPGPDEVEGRDFQHTGHIDIELLKRVLPPGRHLFYVCGPPAMMAALVPGLANWGVPISDIHFESFGPASARCALPGIFPVRAPLAKALDVHFRKSRRTVVWTGEDDNLLDFAERNGIAIDSACRSGSCGACATRLVSGEVHYGSAPDFKMAEGSCLLCVGTPTSNVVLEA